MSTDNSQTTRKVSEALQKAQAICLKHADDLIDASKSLIEQKKFNLAHHMALLALEEVGKFELYRNSLNPTDHGEKSPLTKWGDNHEKKLFWALWTPNLNQLKPEYFLESQKLSQQLHELRLDSLYTGIDAESIQAPKAITVESCSATLSYATARVNVLRDMQFLETTPEEKELTTWFLTTLEDENKRQYFFNPSAMKELQQIGDVRKWIEEIRTKIAEGEAEAAEILKKELSRAETGTTSGKQRWRFRIRLFTNTHSIRGNALKWWNDTIEMIKLSPVGKQKDQLDIHISFSDVVTAQTLYKTGEVFFNNLMIAFNLGSFGLFWRSLPYDQDKFFNEIDDLENPNMKVQISNTNLLFKDALTKRALDQQDLERIANCYAYLTRVKTKEGFAPFVAYRSGLGLLTQTNIHSDFRTASFQEFHRSFKTAALLFGDIKREEDFSEFFKSYVVDKYGPEVPIDQYMSFVNALEGKSERPFEFTTDDLWSYKVFLEAYLVTHIKQAVRKDIIAQRNSKGPTEVVNEFIK